MMTTTRTCECGAANGLRAEFCYDCSRPLPAIEEPAPVCAPLERPSQPSRLARSGGPPLGKLMLVGAVLCGLVFASGPFSRYRMRKRFEPKVTEMALLGYPAARDSALFRRGKVAVIQAPVIDPTKKNVLQPARLDPAHFDLPAGIRASRPEEAQTVIVCDHRNDLEAVYVRGTPHPGSKPVMGAYRHRVTIKVFDVPSRKLLGTQVLRGEPPKDRLESEMESGVGEKPDVAKWVVGLASR